MNARHMDTLQQLRSYVGRRITKIERLGYEFRGSQDIDNGDLQVWFNGDVLRFGVCSDGESLRVEEQPWKDPFAAPLSEENERYVETHGRSVLVDVSAEPGFDALIGQPLQEVLPLVNEFGKLIGVSLHVGPTVVDVHVEFDDLHLTWGDTGPTWRR